MDVSVQAFLGRHNFTLSHDVSGLVDSILFDMHEGLCGRDATQDMIRTYSMPPSGSVAGKSVIAVDAGGTNFRSCLVRFDGQGVPEITGLEKTRMPGVERELSRRDFFDALAANLEHLKGMSSSIGFCFSYPMRITEDGDGVLLGFSKEVKAPEVAGCSIGRELRSALIEHGWDSGIKVAMLNDTVAALLAGAADVPSGVRYGSYVGFILGTGMNAAYIQPPCPDYADFAEQIIVCESGKFGHIARSDFDVDMDRKSAVPGSSLTEKMCSGAYLGPLILEALRRAAAEGLFSPEFSGEISGIQGLSLIDADSFLHAPYGDRGALCIAAKKGTDLDRTRLFELMDAFMDRAASIAAGILCACVVKSRRGDDPCRPVCLFCDGTTFYKTYRMKERVESYADAYLSPRGLHYAVTGADNGITLGSAIAGASC